MGGTCFSREVLLMTSCKVRAGGIAGLVIVLWIAEAAHIASAAVIDFEDPPYMAGQTIIGQDGWATKDYVFNDPFFGGAVNGNATIVAAEPLAGLQSAFYEQTSVPPGAGGTGASDVGKPDVVAAVKHGTAAADLAASFLIRTDANAAGNGSMGLFLGPGSGHSPVFVLLSNANSASGTGNILVAHDFSVSNVGTYVPNNTFEFVLGVDVDNQRYDVSARNVTAGTPALQLSPPGGGSTFAFFGGGIPDDGDGQTFTLDASLLLRSGAGRIDQITLTPIPEPTTLGLALLGLAAGVLVRRGRSLAKNAPPAAALLSALAVQGASAAVIDFENPPYSTGAIVGQEGWVTNGYVGGGFFGGPNGDVIVSSTAPLSGSQSLSFNQTAVTGAGGAPGASDVSKPEVIAVTPGLMGTDLTVSYLISANGNALDPEGAAGIFLSHDAHLGDSPLFARLDGSALVVADTGTIIEAPGFVYFSGDVLEITMNVDLDVSRYELSVNNLTTGQFEFAQSFGFLSPFAAEGPNGEYLVDVGTMLRRGTAKIDNISLVAGTGPLVTELTWSNDVSGNWNQPANWTPGGVPGSNPGRQTAIFGDAITSTQTVFTNSSRTVNSVQFDNENSYVIAGAGSVNLQADDSSGSPVNPSIEVDSGDHQFQVAVNLLDDTTVTVASGASLDFNNRINLGGNTLTLSGDVNINHSTIGGGAIVSSGVLGTEGSANIDGDLVSTGTLLVDVGSSGADVFHVAGNATLSGILDVALQPGTAPTGPLTVLSTGGSLEATSLSLDASDVGAFVLSASGGHLMLTYVGVAVPEPTTIGLGLLGLFAVVLLRPVRGFARNALPAAALLSALAVTQEASAAVIDFENPRYIAGQTIIGQDEWFTKEYVFDDPFFGGVVNGTVEISTTAPLAGLQSVLYSQTVDPPAAGGTGASDVGKPNVVFAVKDGSDAADLTATFLIRTDANAVGNGSMGLFLGPGLGHSPVFVLLSNANSGAGTGNILVATNFELANAGGYVPNNTFEFTLEVDVDNQNYDVFARNVTAGTPAMQLLGPGPDGTFPFFGGGIPDDGDGQTFTLDASLLLRSGAGRIDQINLVGEEFVRAVWSFNVSSDWHQNSSWIPNLIPGVDPGRQTAVFGDAIQAPQTVFTNSTVSVSGIEFDNTNKYVIAGGGAVELKANPANAVNPTISASRGSHEFQVAVNLVDDTTITVADGAALDFNNILNLGGNALATSGDVALNVGVTGGGTIANSGTLGTAGATPIVADLNSTGKLLVDLGPNNTDFFNITGNATLSGFLDVALEPGFTPSGSYTVLTVTGTLNAAGLELDASDTEQFSLGVVGKSLVLNVGGGLPGDFDDNGTVDGTDLAQWKGDFGLDNESDADGDGDSDGADFLIWQRNLGQTSAAPAAAAVPEPSSLVLCLLALGACRALGRTP